MHIYITDEIERVLAQKPLLLVNFSGGKDSQAILHETVTHYRQTHQIEVIYSDTGFDYEEENGWKQTHQWCIEQAAKYGLELHYVTNPHRKYLEEVELRGRFPSSAQRWCTSHHKRANIQKWLRNRTEQVIISIKGMRADESPARSKLLPWELDADLTVTRAKNTGLPRTVYTWLPIHAWPTKYMYEYAATNGIELNPVYQYLPRYSCQICIFHSAKDLAMDRRHNPKAFQRIAELEKRIGFTMNPRGSVTALADMWEAGQLTNEPELLQPCLF